MAKRRTRKQKTATTHQYTLPKSVSRSSKTTTTKKTTPTPTSSTFTAADLYDYDTNLIKKDLYKTILVSTIILALQMGIYFYLR